VIDNGDRPIVCAIHPRLVDELKARRDLLLAETGRKTKGGLTCFSEMAAQELWAIRESGNKIMVEILKLKDLPVKKVLENGTEKEYVPYEIYKKLFNYVSELRTKKDKTCLHIEVAKIRGLQKNEIKYFW